MNITWITPRRGGAGQSGIKHKQNKAISVSVRSNPDKTNGTNTSITIHEKMMKEMRFIAGDRVQVGLTDDGSVVIRRVSEGGFTLTPRCAGGAEKHAGQPVSSGFTASELLKEKGRRIYDRAEITVTSDGMIVIPQQEVFTLKGNTHE